MLNIDLQKLLKNGVSRYELVAATAKRARMIVDAQEKMSKSVKDAKDSKDAPVVDKAVSIAVKELEEGVWEIADSKD